MDGDRYDVKWDRHRDVILENFERMYSLNSLTDCVLMAGEREIHAHKMMLSSCSPYFKKLLEKSSDKVPMLIFNDITFEELRSVIEYMYRGEVTVDGRTASRILKIGSDLKIEGLAHDPKKVKEKPPPGIINYSWSNQPPQPGSNFGPQGYQSQGPSMQNFNNWGYQNYPQQPGYNTHGNMDQSLNYSYSSTANSYGNASSDMGLAGQAGPSGNAQLPSQVLSGQIMDALAGLKKQDASKVPKRKKDASFISPPITRKKPGKVFAELSHSNTSNVQKSENPDKNVEQTPEYTEQTLEKTMENAEPPSSFAETYTLLLENTSTTVVQNEEKEDVSLEMSVFTPKDENETSYTFPSLPPITMAVPLNTVASSSPYSFCPPKTAESVNISEIGATSSYQETSNGNDSDSDNEASDSGINTDNVLTQDEKDEQAQKLQTQERKSQAGIFGYMKKSSKGIEKDNLDESGTSGDGPLFFCSVCSKAYKHRENLSRHRSRECGVDPKFQCDFCSYRAKRKDHLKTHVINRHSH